MLNGTLTLHDIRDVEAFCNHVLERSRYDIPTHDREDIIATLVETTWELSRIYRPGGITFSTWSSYKLGFLLTDWYRAKHGRTRWTFADYVHEREPIVLVSFDSEDTQRELGNLVRAGNQDPIGARDSDRGGLPDRRRNRRRARPDTNVGDPRNTAPAERSLSDLHRIGRAA